MSTVITNFVNQDGKNDINRWYHNGTNRTESDGYRRTGYYNNAPAITRYKFTAPAMGASKIKIEKRDLGLYDDCSMRGEKLAFFITTSATSHLAAYYVEGSQNQYDIDGFFTMTKQSDGHYSISGSVDKILLPNTDYYLYIFPGYTSYVWFTVYGSAYLIVTLDGGAGAIHLTEGDVEFITLPMIKENGKMIELSATIKLDNEFVYGV